MAQNIRSERIVQKNILFGDIHEKAHHIPC